MENVSNIYFSELQNGLTTAYIDSTYNSTLAFRPEFISNDYKQGKKVLTAIEHEISNCEEFCISVAFITEGGIKPLLQIFKELEVKGIPGKILTTDYLTFSEPRALEQLANLNNIEIRMYHETSEDGGFHTKGYIFRKEEMYRIIIGSSNLTGKALTKNKEWNTKIVSTNKGEVAEHILYEFDELWNSVHTQKYEDFIEEYREQYLAKKLVEKQQKMARENDIVDIQSYKLKPNKMQVAFIQRLMRLREKDVKKALLISSTGTGKTFASAFALREMQPHKALFIVHREQIAKQALKSYKRVFGTSKTYGLLSGNHRDSEADFLFSTMQMMAKPEVHELFAKNEFDVIVLDECHHVGANSYQRIMSYFEPHFWLGMTASPDTTSYDIYSVFDHQIAYEIRLQQALEEDLLCPFHYFGITDLEIDGEVFDDKTGVQNFNHLVSDARVDYVIEQAKYYGFSGDRVKGLIFCSRNKEAKELSAKFNQRGLRTEVLSGEDSQERRMEVIERLTSDDEAEEQLDYIFSVDIFNEGIDIPEVNQVIMLRPTESPVVFIQQLGRGLRKFDDKEYVVILDFIGNYMNNFMIPIALSGDRTYNKDTIRKYVISGNNVIPGVSTIHFDEVSKKRIFSSIDKISRINDIIKKSYIQLKNRLGRIPYLIDFYREGEVDPLLILSQYKTYHNFLEAVETSYNAAGMTSEQKLCLEYLSKVISSGKRPHELVILKKILSEESAREKDIKEALKRDCNVGYVLRDVKGAVGVLQAHFVAKEDELEKYACARVLDWNEQGCFSRTKSLVRYMQNKQYNEQLNDLVELGINRYRDLYMVDEEGVFVLYNKYSRRDVCQLLNWGRDLSSTMYGMKRVDDDVCIFVTYNKAEASGDQVYIDGKPDYADEFISNEIFMWDSQIGKGPDSSYMKDVKDAKNKHLFVKKSDAEGVDFYYMGQFDILEIAKAEKKDKAGKMKEIAKVRCKMHNAVRDDILNYLSMNLSTT